MPIRDYLTSGAYPLSFEGPGPTSQALSRLVMTGLQAYEGGQAKRQAEVEEARKRALEERTHTRAVEKEKRGYGEKAKDREFGMEKMKANLLANVYGDVLGQAFRTGGWQAVYDTWKKLDTSGGVLYGKPEFLGGGEMRFPPPDSGTGAKIEKGIAEELAFKRRPKTYAPRDIMDDIRQIESKLREATLNKDIYRRKMNVATDIQDTEGLVKSDYEKIFKANEDAENQFIWELSDKYHAMRADRQYRNVPLPELKEINDAVVMLWVAHSEWDDKHPEYRTELEGMRKRLSPYPKRVPYGLDQTTSHIHGKTPSSTLEDTVKTYEARTPAEQYRIGETRVINGITYIRNAKGQWLPK